MFEYQLDFISESPVHSLTPEDVQQFLPFHAVECGQYHVGEHYYVRRDGMKNYLLIVTTDGCGRMNWQGQSCVLEPGSAVLVDCELYQEYGTVPGQEWHFYYLHFNALSIEGYRNVLLRKLTPVTLRSLDEAQKLMKQLYRTSFKNNVAAYAMISNIISGLLTEMVCSLTEDEENTTHLNRTDVASLAEFIRNNFYEDLHIDDFMKHTCLSRHYLIHVFERQIGMSPYRYLHMCRINYAQVLLKTTDMTITEIAYSIGYSNAAVFIRHFKSFNRVTPTIYRSESVHDPDRNYEV